MTKSQTFLTITAATALLLAAGQVIAAEKAAAPAPATKTEAAAPTAAAAPAKATEAKKPRMAGDTDKDGRISKSEHMAQAEARFKDMDKDADGYVTKAERDSYFAAERAKRDAAKAAKGDKTAPAGEEKPKGLFGGMFK